MHPPLSPHFMVTVMCGSIPYVHHGLLSMATVHEHLRVLAFPQKTIKPV